MSGGSGILRVLAAAVVPMRRHVRVVRGWRDLVSASVRHQTPEGGGDEYELHECVSYVPPEPLDPLGAPSRHNLTATKQAGVTGADL